MYNEPNKENNEENKTKNEVTNRKKSTLSFTQSCAKLFEVQTMNKEIDKALRKMSNKEIVSLYIDLTVVLNIAKVEEVDFENPNTQEKETIKIPEIKGFEDE